MRLMTQTYRQICLVSLDDERFDRKRVPSFISQINGLIKTGQRHFVFDFSKVRHVDFSALTAVVTVFQSLGSAGSAGLCGLDIRASARLKQAGLESVFVQWPDARAALNYYGLSPINCLRTSGMQAVVLSGKRSQSICSMAPGQTSAMFPLLHRPVLDHVLNYLSVHGQRKVVASVDYGMPEIEGYFGQGDAYGIDLKLSSEAIMTAAGSVPAPLGSTASLRQSLLLHGPGDMPVLAITMGCLPQVDLTAMQRAHNRTGADITLSGSATIGRTAPSDNPVWFVDHDGEVKGQGSLLQVPPDLAGFADTGVMILSSRALDLLPDVEDFDLVAEFVPVAIKSGLKVALVRDDAQRMLLSTLSDIYSSTCHLLDRNACSNAQAQEASYLFADHAATCHISPDARISGQVSFGTDVVVQAGVEISGPTVIGAGSFIAKNSRINRSLLMPGTNLAEGARINDLIVNNQQAMRLHPQKAVVDLPEPVLLRPDQVPETLSKQAS